MRSLRFPAHLRSEIPLQHLSRFRYLFELLLAGRFNTLASVFRKVLAKAYEGGAEAAAEGESCFGEDKIEDSENVIVSSILYLVK